MSVDFASTLTESEFSDRVIDRARARGWLVHHGRPARSNKGWRTPIQGDIGFPDLVLARAGTVIIAELKRESGRLRPTQREWFGELAGDGNGVSPTRQIIEDGHPTVLVTVWRPSQWPEICEVLE